MAEKIIVLATGTKDGGGTGLEQLLNYFNKRIETEEGPRIVGVVCNIRDGGVERIASKNKVDVMHLPNEHCTPQGYDSISRYFGAHKPWYVCSGWRRLVHVKVGGKWGHILDLLNKNAPGLPNDRTINIHPALLSQLSGRFGGPQMYGKRIHEEVKLALDAGQIDEATVRDGESSSVAYSGFTMHFVSPEYDKGPVFAEVRVSIDKTMNTDAIGERVRRAEHAFQPLLTEMVVKKQIRLVDGKVLVPNGYALLPK